MSLALFLEAAARREPNKTALVCGDEQASYSLLHRTATSFAAACARLGIRPGARVAILTHNCVAYVAALFGLLRIGTVCAPLNTRLTAGEIKQLLEQCMPAALLYGPECSGSIPARLPGGMITIPLNELQRSRSTDAAMSPLPGWDDPAVILYTAGTTGTAKGVVLTHANILWNTLNYTAAYGMCPADIELAPTPLFHASTLGRLFTYVFNAATFILCRSFDPQQCLELIQDERVTSLTQVPTMYRMLCEAARRSRYDLRSVRRVVTGAAPMNPHLKQQVADLFPDARCHDVYGLSEAGPGVTISRPQDFLAKPGSVGRPMLSVELAVADAKDTPVPAGTVGEIICRGPNVMQGYDRDPEATAVALRNGWLHTGDEGFLDDEGCLHIVGRRKEIIISGGVNIYPAEVEGVLAQHPAIADVAVVGVPNEQWGEKVAAALVLRDGGAADPQDILSFCRERLAGFKCPKALFFLDSLPRNAAQKVLKQELVRGIVQQRYRATPSSSPSS